MNCKQLRVGLFCETWGSGGIESFLLNILPYVDRERFHIQVITVKLESDFYLSRLRRLGVDLVCFPESRRSCHAQFHSFYKMLRDNRYDILHFNLFEGLALGYVRAAEAAGIPVRIVHSHNTDLRESFLRPAKLAVHACARAFFSSAATCRLACSRPAAEFLFPAAEIAAGRWLFVPNGICEERFVFDPEKRCAMRRELRVSGQLVVGCIGRLCRQKNQEFLLHIFAQLHAKEPRSHLILVGEGPDEAGLRKLCSTLGLNGAVTFYGVSPRVPELLCAFDVLAFPSLFEGLGIVAVEAQAAGLPVVCSDRVPREAAVTGLAEFLPVEAGASDWAEHLLAAGHSERRDMSAEVRREGYSIERVAERLQEIWNAGNALERG